MLTELIIVYVIWNAIVMIVYGLDKLFAKKNMRRVPEKTLFVLAVMLGAVGAWAGMRIFRHKTKHNSFVFGIPLLALVNLAAIFFILYRLDI